MKIFIVMHKIMDVHKIKGLFPLLVGSEKLKEKTDPKIYRDDTGDNISNKNANYCELTGMYWMWKNKEIKDDEIIGLCHYRRYFLKNIFSTKLKNYLNQDDIEKILKKYDVIVPARRFNKEKIKEGLKTSTTPYPKDMKKTKEIIKEKYPEYLEYWDEFYNQKSECLYNMFIAKKSVMNDYFSWLFDILFTLEKEIDISNYDPYSARIYGFISERLFNMWLMKNKDKLKIKEKYVYKEPESYFTFLKHEIANVGRRIIYGK